MSYFYDLYFNKIFDQINWGIIANESSLFPRVYMRNNLLHQIQEKLINNPAHFLYS
jgi:hypothetical protein